MSDDVVGRFYPREYLVVTTHIDCQRGVVAIHDDQHIFPLVAAALKIQSVVGHKVCHFAVRQARIVLSPFQERAAKVESLVLERGAVLGKEIVDGVARESSREVESNQPVTLLFAPVHENFGAIINLRDSPGSEQECDGLFVKSQIPGFR